MVDDGADHRSARLGLVDRCGLTADDLFAHLRMRGVFDLVGVRYVLFEAKGGVTVVPETEGAVPPLVREGLDSSTGWRESGGA